MKLNRILLTLAVMVAMIAAAVPAGAAQRIVLMEHFTNAGCPPCAAVNPSLRAMSSALTHDTVVVVAYHTAGPGYDPMYNYNSVENGVRSSFYSLQYVPYITIDGTYGLVPDVSSIPGLRTYIRGRYAASSPCTMDFTAMGTGDTGVQVVGTITAEQDMLSANLRLYVALITDTVQYQSPPGTNGETLFPDVFRDMWPNGNGQAFTLAAGQTYNFNAALVRDAAWNPEDLQVVVWVQDYATRVVHQAGITRLSQNYAMTTASASPRQTIADLDGGILVYTVDVTNLGLLGDTYDVDLEGTIPGGWTHTVEAAGVPADPLHIQVPVASGQTATLTVRLDPSGHPGSLDFVVRVQSVNEPALNATESFVLMSGLDLLVVDDDLGGNRETWYLNALAAIDVPMLYGRWDVSRGPLLASYLNGVDLVIWLTGDAWQDGTTITAQDQAILSSYLDQGGLLFMSGQGIGYDIGSDPFFTDYIHGVYLVNHGGNFSLLGIPDDPIGSNLMLTINGGGGASNQTRQHSTNPDATGLATPILAWANPPGVGGYPALKVDAPNYRLVYLGFGFEAISGEIRNTLLQRIIDWLLPDGPPAAPEFVTAGRMGNSVVLRWEPVDGAVGYVVYSSTTVDGSYTEDLSGTFDETQWTAPMTALRKFYYVTALR